MKYDTNTSPERTHYQRIDVRVHINRLAILLNSVNERSKLLHESSSSARGLVGLFRSTGIVQYRFWGGLRKDTLRKRCC